MSQYLARSDSGVQVRCCDSGSGAGQTETGARDSGHETRGYIQVTFSFNLCSFDVDVLSRVKVDHVLKLGRTSGIFTPDSRSSRRNTEF